MEEERTSSSFEPTCVDGKLRIVQWATDLGYGRQQLLGIDLGERPSPMAHSNATGQSLVSNGYLGVDIIRLAAGEGFIPHTHEGHHLLIITGGQGTITYDGLIYPTSAGQIYMIEGMVPHAVGAITDHVIMAVGAPHVPVASTDRMEPVPYADVMANTDTIYCLICHLAAEQATRLHQLGCPHCPCGECHS